MEEKTFQTDKGQIHYWINTVMDNRPTLVFLPGLTADHRLFNKQIEKFGGKYNLLVWDAPGHGASRPFDMSISLDDKAGYLHEILGAENIKMPVLIGQSMGGYVSQCYMDLYPDSVSGFISIDSAPLKRKYVTAAEIWLLKRTGPLYRAYPWQTLIKSGAKGCAETEYGRNLMKDMMNTYTKAEYCALASCGYAMLAKAMEEDRPYVIDCPALLLCGEHDKAGSTRRYNRAWSKAEGLQLLWIDNAGHNANTDNPQMVNAALEEFVKNVKRTREYS